MARKLLIKPFHSIESTATASHNWRRRQVLRAGASTIALALLGPKLAHASSVLGVRVWPARDYTRFPIAADQPLQNSQQFLQGPDRLVVAPARGLLEGPQPSTSRHPSSRPTPTRAAPPARLGAPAPPPKARVPDNPDEFFQKYAHSDLPRAPPPSAPGAPVPPVAPFPKPR